jgi:hypothetical protein
MSFRVLAIVAILVISPVAAFLHYVLPRHDVVRIVNTEVRRVDASGKPVGGGENAGASRDVFYIFAEDVDDKAPRVYRNEDTGWGFPPYFKFNSADEQAIASSIAQERGVALITKYGWRVHLFSWFPNATNVRRWDPAHSVTPWFNIVFFVTLFALAGWLTVRVRRKRAR